MSVLYYALLPSDQVPAVDGDKTEEIEWADPERPGHRLAFDHANGLDAALAKIGDNVERDALPLHLLPDKFTLTELQRACEAILGRDLDRGRSGAISRMSPRWWRCLTSLCGGRSGPRSSIGWVQGLRFRLRLVDLRRRRSSIRQVSLHRGNRGALAARFK